ncbi:alpha/beta fold hydrolase [Streptomyces pinistramenti]|uniref:alpha/beta fold hydrolase n=1 Tax=Streptomyces pinistramenti TaxID=2884812 RepID=UPI001D084F97|nr:alpha/beta fold hydrolase [Streptomyces pinistramenti]MCB5912108.1 alpha/beta fold hydrolase [Streptomyces pinistramenti]
MYVHDHLGQPLTSARRSVNGTTLHYRTGGQGEPVVLLHGAPKTSYHWRDVVPYLTPHHTVITPDLRGFGDSAPAATGFDTATLADDIAELMSALGFDSYRVVGEDWGAAVGYRLAARHPGHVRQLVYQEAYLAGFGWEEMTHLSAERVAAGQWIHHIGFFFQPDVPEMLITGRERQFIDHWMSQEAHHVDALSADFLDEYVRCARLPGRLRAMLAVYRASLEDAELNRAAARTPLPMPVLAVGGRYAMGGDPARQMREVATDVREVLLDAGHHPAQEAPRETAEAYREFFTGGR